MITGSKTRLTWILAIALPVSLIGANAFTEQPASDRSRIEAGQAVSLTIEPVVKDGLIRLDVRWSGQEPESILVITLASKKEMLFGPREMSLGHTDLSGIVLFRKLSSALGELTVRLNAEHVQKFLDGDRNILGHVRVVDRINLLIRDGDPGVKGGLRVIDEKEIGPSDCTAQLRFLCGGYSDGWFAPLSPDVEPPCVGVPGKLYVKPVAYPDGQAALLSFGMRIGKGDSAGKDGEYASP